MRFSHGENKQLREDLRGPKPLPAVGKTSVSQLIEVKPVEPPRADNIFLDEETSAVVTSKRESLFGPPRPAQSPPQQEPTALDTRDTSGKVASKRTFDTTYLKPRHRSTGASDALKQIDRSVGSLQASRHPNSQIIDQVPEEGALPAFEPGNTPPVTPLATVENSVQQIGPGSDPFLSAEEWEQVKQAHSNNEVVDPNK